MERTARQPTYDELVRENRTLKAEVSLLQEELAQLRRLIFGQKRERFIALTDSQQLEIALGENETTATPAEETERITYLRRKKAAAIVKRPSRNLLPAHLPRVEIHLQPEGDVSGLKRMGEEITEELEYQPPKFYVNRYIRPKYTRPEGEGVVIATLPSRPIDKGIPGPALLAHIIISKYVDHLPLYRQRQQFRRFGVDIADSTMCDWIKASCGLLLPISEAQRLLIQQSSYLMADETPLAVLDRHLVGRCHLGYHWVYYDPLTKLAFFDYQPGRSRAGPNDILRNFKGYLQSDGYVGYDDVTARPEVIAVGCMAHARRYFDKAKDYDRAPAEWMLLRIQELYLIERQAREDALSFEQRYQLRQQQALSILHDIKAWLDRNVTQFLPKSAMGKAVGYMLRQWQKLVKYVTDGRLEIDNNLVENAIRPVALGRKNYLFAGSHAGAKRAAIIYTLAATAKLHNVEPFTYFKDLLDRLPDHPHKQVADLLPQNWAPRKS